MASLPTMRLLELPFVHRFLISKRGSRLLRQAAGLPLPTSLMIDLAHVATHKVGPELAVDFWRAVAVRRPDWTIGIAGQANALRQLNRRDEAEKLLRDGLERFRGDRPLLGELAFLLEERGEYEAMREVWQELREADPNTALHHVGLGTALRRLLRFDEAETVLANAVAQFPQECFVLANHAVNADAMGNREEALTRWKHVQARFPDEPIGYAGVGAALKMLGRYDEADTWFEQAMQRFPSDENIAVNHGYVAVQREDWAEARRRWSRLKSRWPTSRVVAAGYAETTLQADLAEADREETQPRPAAVAVEEATTQDPLAEMRQIVSGFESLGENCELGFVQRHFGAEPLGLFRWAGIDLNALVTALETRLEGIGAPEFTILSVNPNNREYYTEDSRYGMSMHTFILEGSSPPDKVLSRICRRLVFLRDKLLGDLADGGKVFVLNTRDLLPDADLLRLHRALCLYGPNRLLHVSENPDLPPGTVRQLLPGIWHATLTRTGFNGKNWDVDFDTWLALFRAFLAMQDAPVGVDAVTGP